MQQYTTFEISTMYINKYYLHLKVENIKLYTYVRIYNPTHQGRTQKKLLGGILENQLLKSRTFFNKYTKKIV